MALPVLHALLGLFAEIAFVVLGLQVGRTWWRTRQPSTAWLAGAFGLVGVAVALGWVFGDEPAALVSRFTMTALVGFPVALVAFSERLTGRPASTRIALGTATTVVLAGTWLLPADTATRYPGLLGAYVLGFLGVFAGGSAVVSWRLWRAGASRSRLVRQRLRMIGVGTAMVATTLVATSFSPDGQVGVAVVIGDLLAIAAAVVFWLGFAPPALLRWAWRREDERRTWSLVTDLLAAGEEVDVPAVVVPAVISLVGARRAVLYRNGEPVASAGDVAVDAATADVWERPGETLVVVPWREAELLVWLDEQTPLFGAEDLELLRRLVMVGKLVEDQQRRVGLERLAGHHLERASTMRSALITAVSHELRTPITIIRGFAETLRDAGDSLSPESEREVVGRILDGSDRLNTIVDDLLLLGRVDRPNLDRTPVDVAGLLKGQVDQTARRTRRPIDVTVTGTAAAAVVTGDEAGLATMLVKLTDNALRYSPPTEPVRVHADVIDGQLTVAFTDGGDGIDPEVRRRALAPFGRGDVVNAASPGLGLGLSVANRVARDHDGHLRIEDGPNGNGSTVTVALPCTTRAHAAPNHAAPATDRRRR